VNYVDFKMHDATTKTLGKSQWRRKHSRRPKQSVFCLKISRQWTRPTKIIRYNYVIHYRQSPVVLNGIVLGNEEGEHEATNTVPAVQRPQPDSMSKTNQSSLLKEIVVVYCHKRPIRNSNSNIQSRIQWHYSPTGLWPTERPPPVSEASANFCG
jgi:hypothetical protein